jgi:hypothetical protein
VTAGAPWQRHSCFVISAAISFPPSCSVCEFAGVRQPVLFSSHVLGDFCRSCHLLQGLSIHSHDTCVCLSQATNALHAVMSSAALSAWSSSVSTAVLALSAVLLCVSGKRGPIHANSSGSRGESDRQALLPSLRPLGGGALWEAGAVWEAVPYSTPLLVHAAKSPCLLTSFAGATAVEASERHLLNITERALLSVGSSGAHAGSSLAHGFIPQRNRFPYIAAL